MGHESRPGEADPVLVEVLRGGFVESRHRGAAVVADGSGRVLAGWGDIDAPVFPRSAIKPIQALPLVESGALAAYGLGSAELALACASHTAEAEHLRIAGAWLARLGLTEAALACGPRVVSDKPDGPAPIGRPLANNCSGKHLGMITTALHKGEPVHGYTRIDHPVQQRGLGVLEQLTAQDLGAAPRGIDGCSIPLLAVPLGALAVAMARLGQPERFLPERRAQAATQVLDAWRTHPHLIGGTGIFDTRLIALTGGRVLVKRGAEGVLCACLPEEGLGVAVKIADGAGRAAAVAMAAVLAQGGALDGVPAAAREPLERPALLNAAGVHIGGLRPTAAFTGGAAEPRPAP